MSEQRVPYPDQTFSAHPSTEETRLALRRFADERDWVQYHTPRNLLLAMVGEVGEISELFQWRGEVKPGLPDWTEEEKVALEDELADVYLYLLRLSDACGVDLPAASKRKIAKNAIKYPVNKAFGSSQKYTQYSENSNGQP